jgi:hypothetical protein
MACVGAAWEWPETVRRNCGFVMDIVSRLLVSYLISLLGDEGACC